MADSFRGHLYIMSGSLKDSNIPNIMLIISCWLWKQGSFLGRRGGFVALGIFFFNVIILTHYKLEETVRDVSSTVRICSDCTWTVKYPFLQID